MKTPTKQLKERSGVGKRRLSAYLKVFQSTSVDMFLVLSAKYLLMTHFQMKKNRKQQRHSESQEALPTSMYYNYNKKKFMRKLHVKHKNKCSDYKIFFLEFL